MTPLEGGTVWFITGDLSPRSQWHADLATLDSMGLGRYLELVNKWYSAKYGS